MLIFGHNLQGMLNNHSSRIYNICTASHVYLHLQISILNILQLLNIP